MISTLLKVLACQAAGEIIVTSIGLPVPGAIVGMALLFGCLVWLGSVPENLGKVFDSVVPHMPLFFIPAGVGIIAEIETIRQGAAIVAAAVLVGTAVAIAVSAILADRMTHFQSGSREQEGPAE